MPAAPAAVHKTIEVFGSHMLGVDTDSTAAAHELIGGQADSAQAAAAAAANEPAATPQEGAHEASLGAQLAEQVKLIGQLLEQQRQDELLQQQQGAASPQQLAVLQQAADALLFSPGELWCLVRSINNS
jgi:hypothetical protein